ncbi:DNA phosphorothioation system sulfurtransferase DndC [Anabaena sphaerica FACHB-251]|uniref:DNA phosphorothioation system sulfurtransferase DndC n=1 Tax=Anabaena sphaerica FACHB-251 TaxID=2692883 RepID=A0A926ZZ63_9NOST|nr:DNA phosphorothioation system sulfurtransferase DndC [Anabaena sphaerica]MBD2292191.1 DNA phosphorothioation system sulfurtransferase DndC [Anabaena sphaerica FACHB-251]
MTTGQQPDSKTQQNRTVAELVDYIQVLTTEIQELYCLDAIPWVIGYSGGKDSTATLQLIWNAISQLPPEKRTKTIHVITTDTLVENPIVATWVRQSLEQMKVASKAQGIPIEPNLLQPEIKETFWVSLIGKGYPAPRGKFRWCTDRLKIHPSNRFIRDILRVQGEVILILGTRKAESIKRAISMEKHRISSTKDRLNYDVNSNQINSLLYYSSSLPNALIYSPIEDWRTEEVWIYLNQWENPWGYSNKDLFNMYRGATADNECPLVVDTSTPSCGDSRFGCWVCTIVSKDKSMEAMIQNDEEKEWMQPLLNMRNELDIRDDRNKRDFRRLRGEVQLFERNLDGEKSIEPIYGPYTKDWREYWLRKLLTAQTEMRQTAPENMRDITLISMEELSEIRRIWLEEKHEFDDSLPRIYQEVTGEAFKDPRPGSDYSLLGSDEWEVLEEICDGDGMQLELMAKLLDTERQFRKKTRRVGIYESLEKCFDTSSRSQEEAIKNAHLKRDLREAASKGDVATIRETFKQLNIGETPAKEENKPDSFAGRKFKKKEE